MNNIPAIEKESLYIKTVMGLNANIRVNHLISMLKDSKIDDTNNTDFLYHNKGLDRWEVRRKIKNGDDT